MQKEFKNLLLAIDKWVKANDKQVSFIGSFISFDTRKIEKDEDDISKDNIILAYGGKKELKLVLKELQNRLKEEKGDFVNW